ncbi:MAG: hypothetical protein DDT34_02414 [Firmicutes bacterium]|nr:hypothetical protein [Bacillota bacterium]
MRSVAWLRRQCSNLQGPDMSCQKLDELLDAATLMPSPADSDAASTTQPIETRSRALDALLNRQLTALLDTLLIYERKKAQVNRVDGLIIGTGEADFTKGNTLYPLSYHGKRFQLIDVPGIEGDERKYAPMVREAVAKAHLVFYVNGTNKKPEKATAKKIRSYLKFGTQVCPLINAVMPIPTNSRTSSNLRQFMAKLPMRP